MPRKTQKKLAKNGLPKPISLDEVREKHPRVAAVIDGLVSDPELKARGFKIKAIYPPSRT